MTKFLQLLIAGLAMGSIYAMVAMGFTFIWNAARLINFAHGQCLTIGAYLFSAWLLLQVGLPWWLAGALMILAMSLFGAITAVLIFNPLRKVNLLFAVIATVGFGLILREVVRLVWGPEPLAVQLFQGTFHLGEIVVGEAYVYILLVTVTILCLQYLMFNYTRLGKTMRAVSQDQEVASLMGINVPATIILGVGYVSAVAGVAGMMVAPVIYIYPNMADTITLKAFASTVIGGFGSIPGALAGALLLGVSETLVAGYISAIYRDVVAFVCLVLFLVFIPYGLFHREA